MRAPSFLTSALRLIAACDMKHVPTLTGVAILFGIVYYLTKETLTGSQLVVGIAAALLVYTGVMVWHIRNLLD
jgi:hypothetical protein